MPTSPGIRVASFALAGIAFFAYWSIFDPTNDAKASQFEWRFVIGFTSALLILALAVWLYGEMVGGRWVRRVSMVGTVGLIIGGLSNIFEDGLGIDWVFFVFVLGTALALIALVAAAIVIAVTNTGRRRLLALVPAGTAVAVVAFVAIGGPLMLATWLIAATIAFRARGHEAPPLPA
jgi:hypothetical protein